jgi:phosphatidate cytidylyltransferase
VSQLLQRVVTAIVLLAVLLLVFFTLPPAAAIGALGLFIVIAAWEWSGFLRFPSSGLRAAYAIVLTALVVAVAWLGPQRLPLVPLLSVGLCWWACAFVWVLRYPTPVRRDVGAVCGILVILPAWAAIVAMLRMGDVGPQYVLFVLAIVWAADIGAYFVGRRLGRRKLAPRVSPGKTWEGLAGGLIAAGAAGAGGAWWFGFSPALLAPVGLTVGAISVVGDLTISMFKRSAGLKDSGNLFPGHGGVFDRVDSITAAVPLFVLEFTWLGLFEH